MSAIREQSRSLWMDVEMDVAEAPIDLGSPADVAIVGAGIAGLSIAYELVQRGRSVVVLDRGPIAGGMTSRTTAHLAPICDDSLAELLSMRGAQLARGFQESQSAAVDRIEEIIAKERIDCDFRRLDGLLILDPTSQEKLLFDELDAAKEIGVKAELGRGLDLPGLQDTPYLRYPDQAAFHPLKYLKGLCAAIVAKGGRLHPNVAVDEIGEDGELVRLKLSTGQTLEAEVAVVTTNAPIHDQYQLHTKQAPYRTYAMAFEIEPGLLPDALYWDTLDPYHYVRLATDAAGAVRLIVGGADHKTGEANDAIERFAALESWIRTYIPKLGRETHRWSGQVMDTVDFCGFIGLDAGSERIYVSTGDSGQGITHGVVASLVIPPMICGEASPYAEVYDPARKPGQAVGRFISENATIASNMAEYLAPGEVSSIEELDPGNGAIIRHGVTKIAAYRAEDGSLFQRSAVCTHLGCHLKWNAFERCWDCPCHGSHFAPDGSVLNGPAIAPLPAAEE